MNKFYDTCAALKLGSKIFDDGFFYISSVTLEELEKIKQSKNKDEQVKFQSRQLLRLLDENQDKYEVIFADEDVLNRVNGLGLEITPDNKICACASTLPDVQFVTDDLACKMIAKHIFSLKVGGVKGEQDQIYKGYKTLHGSTELINRLMGEMDYSEWHTNEYLIIENTDDGSVKEMRYDGENFVALKLPPSKYIKGKNSLQRCALDILNNPDITIAAILGGYGSGKTFLSMQMALYNVCEKGRASKILGVREPIGEGHEVGYLPGDLESKVGSFYDPMTQQLDGGEFELESLKQRGILDTNILYYMKGTTYNNTVILVDEAEDLNDKQIKLVGTRLGIDSRIYFAGDYKQSLLTKTTNNALIKMCNELKGNKKFACIYLGEDVRSETSKIFADLFIE